MTEPDCSRTKKKQASFQPILGHFSYRRPAKSIPSATKIGGKMRVSASNLLGFEAHAALVCGAGFDIGSGT
jgi:hypothetical protein